MISILSIRETSNLFFLFLIIILIIIAIYLYNENKKLKEKITALEKENKTILDKKVINNANEDKIPIKNISTTSKPKPVEKNPQTQSVYVATIPKKAKITSSANTTVDKPIPRINQVGYAKKSETTSTNPGKKVSDNKAYQKNVLKNQTKVTSPISISSTTKDTFDMDKLSFDLNEFIKRSEKVVPIIKEKPQNKDYLKEISNKMANELKPQTIELTDYEKEQEEHAIISYQELLTVRDKLKIQDDEEGTVDFIEELKNFRNTLN